jgi:hypothetical protein
VFAQEHTYRPFTRSVGGVHVTPTCANTSATTARFTTALVDALVDALVATAASRVNKEFRT